MELEVVGDEIGALKTDLVAAKSCYNHGKVKELKHQIAAAQHRRARLIAHLTKNLAASVGSSHHWETMGGADSCQPDGFAREFEEDLAEPDPQNSQIVDITGSRLASPCSDAIEGVTVMSDELAATDIIEHAIRQVRTRRAEMLARHAEEIKALDADQSEVDAMARTIDAFIRKFNLPSSGSSIVQFDEEREMRLQSYG